MVRMTPCKTGSSTVNQPFTGTLYRTANGRVDVTLFPPQGPQPQIPEVFWMVSPSRAFFLVADLNKVEEGTLDLQQINVFATGDLKGQYALVMDG